MNDPPGDIVPGDIVMLAAVTLSVAVGEEDTPLSDAETVVASGEVDRDANVAPIVSTVAENDPSLPTVIVDGVVFRVPEAFMSLSLIVTVPAATNPVPVTLKLSPV